MIGCRTQLLMALHLGLLFLVACAPPTGQPSDLPSPQASVTAERVMERVMATAVAVSPAVITATSTPTVASQPAQVDLDAIFPPGKGRDLVLSTCGNCHPWVCAIKGQRPRTHWATLKATHLGLTPALSDEEYDVLWTYLAEHFNDTSPEPPLPPEFQQLDCARGI